MKYLITTVGDPRPDSFKPSHTSYPLTVKDDTDAAYTFFYSQPSVLTPPKAGDSLEGTIEQRTSKNGAEYWKFTQPDQQRAKAQNHSQKNNASIERQVALKEARAQLRDLIELSVEKVANGKEYMQKLRGVYQFNVHLLKDGLK